MRHKILPGIGHEKWTLALLLSLPLPAVSRKVSTQGFVSQAEISGWRAPPFFLADLFRIRSLCAENWLRGTQRQDEAFFEHRRKDPAKGYHADNIRALTLLLNSRLAHAKMPQWLKDEMILAEQGKLQQTAHELEIYIL